MGETEDFTVLLINEGETTEVLIDGWFSTYNDHSQLTLKSPKFPVRMVLVSGDFTHFILTCKAKVLGLSSGSFLFHFEGFTMEVPFKLNVITYKKIEPVPPPVERTVKSSPAIKGFSHNDFDFSNCPEGTKPFKTVYCAGMYPEYEIPDRLFKIFLNDPELCKSGTHSEKLTLIVNFFPSLSERLSINNYKERFHALLYLNEIEEKVSWRKYDLRGVVLRREDPFLCLKIPFTIQSLGLGSKVFVTTHPSSKQIGYIYKFQENEAWIRFHVLFHDTYDGSLCDVMFQPGRAAFLRCHAAVDMATSSDLKKNSLFPSKINERPPLVKLKNTNLKKGRNDRDSVVADSDKKKEVKWINDQLNDLQKAAVINILEGKGRSTPYIIQGPPGTGKSATVIELILQIYNLIPDSRIIVGTPSNTAADVICEGLVKLNILTPGQFIRILSCRRASSRNVSEKIIPFCVSVDDYASTWAEKNEPSYGKRFEPERIVIGTCNTLAVLHNFDPPVGHFSHAIIDEAAQATEPESLILWNFLDRESDQFILCGDTQQLGPISINFISRRYGFTQSLMERLNKRTIYVQDKRIKYPQAGGYDSRCITRLRKNYRSVPEILKLPSRLFYNSELIPTLSGTEGTEAEIIQKFNALIGRRDLHAPILFNGIQGSNYQEKGSYSWYNPEEARNTVYYLKILYSMALEPDDIGIITPYRKQVEKVRQLISDEKIPLPEIGSVNEFQGHEKKVIILSVVRSDVNQPEKSDKLGFVACPKRINVAMTRARALLIILGNPFTLCSDPCWAKIIKYCVESNYYVGCPIDDLKLKK